MKKDAEEHADADKKKKEEADVRNETDQLLFQTDKTLKELKGKVSEDEIKKAEDAKAALQKAKDDNNIEEMKSKKDDLNKIVQDLTVKLYQQAQQQNGGAQGNPTGGASNNDDKKGNDGNTVDGDFQEVDLDDKK
ncbi:chaperone DnaK [Limosilactobacillus coleohominis DSM 14060]|nr:chaperone DnaK [Limosilactobacillus coleohominis DSM 14060]